MKQKREMKSLFAVIVGVLVFAAMPVLVFAEGNQIMEEEPDSLLMLAEEETEEPTIGWGTGLVAGDINWDWEVDAEDASWILMYAAHDGVGRGEDFAQEEKLNVDMCDINDDGAVDATDAAMILDYAAAVGAGSYQPIEKDTESVLRYFGLAKYPI